jgi:allophanate hydrolase subunit 2
VPVVLGPDHATLGGYPVVATVIGADLSLLGRCRPGDAVRLVPVTAAAAADAWRARRTWRERAVVGHYPTASGT